MNWSNFHCLVTGGAGFIGSHLSEKLLALGSKVTILDDLSTGSEDNINFLESNGAHFINHSVTEIEDALNLLNKIDFIFHQAAQPSVTESIENPVNTTKINLLGTVKVL